MIALSFQESVAIMHVEAVLCRLSCGGEQEALYQPLDCPSKPHVASVPLAGGHAGPQLGKSGLFAGSLGQGVNFCESVP